MGTSLQNSSLPICCTPATLPLLGVKHWSWAGSCWERLQQLRAWAIPGLGPTELCWCGFLARVPGQPLGPVRGPRAAGALTADPRDQGPSPTAASQSSAHTHRRLLPKTASPTETKRATAKGKSHCNAERSGAWAGPPCRQLMAPRHQTFTAVILGEVGNNLHVHSKGKGKTTTGEGLAGWSVPSHSHRSSRKERPVPEPQGGQRLVGEMALGERRAGWQHNASSWDRPGRERQTTKKSPLQGDRSPPPLPNPGPSPAAGLCRQRLRRAVQMCPESPSTKS